jgi:hypothetical protein
VARYPYNGRELHKLPFEKICIFEVAYFCSGSWSLIEAGEQQQKTLEMNRATWRRLRGHISNHQLLPY